MASDTLLSADRLRTRCDPDQFKFRSTGELEDLTEMVGQARAIEAVEFAIGTGQPGYNLFVLGPPGTGRHSFVRRYLTAKAADQEAPSDWCYVNNFDRPREPLALELPAGWGSRLCRDLDRLIDEAYTSIPSTFESDEYRERRQGIEKAFAEEQTKRFQEMQERAAESGIAIMRTPTGVAFAPLKDGKAMPPEQVQDLSEEEKARLEKISEKLGEELQEAMQAMPHLVREVRERIHELDRQVAMLAAGSLIDELLARYSKFAKVVSYLHSVQTDIIDNFSLFLLTPEMQAQMAAQHPRQLSIQQPKESPAKRRYCANLIVDHSDNHGAPVLIEDHPNYPNLIGEVEYLAHMGAMETDFSLIRSGALHRANGGYLVLDVMKVVTEPFAWQGLKQALKAGEIRIESLGKSFGLVPAASLEPEPIPLNLKVILIGDRRVYYQLQALDPEFSEHFKVAADFDDRMERHAENNLSFAQLLGTIARQENLLPLDPTGVARLIEESARHAEHADKLSAQIRRAADIMREANYWAKSDDDRKVNAHHIQDAIDHRIRRAGRIKERLQEAVLEGSILIDTEGAEIGQINGLAVMQVGDYAFARPARISARASLGGGEVVDIERETELGGPLHSKGVLILSGYLAATYAADLPLSLSASIVMEQSYGGVDGDSASAAELLALLSSLSRVPLKQSLAITGSVNQLGQVQAIGGVNAKIEGFFDICAARDLTGDQGVIIPSSNIKNLMLRTDVVDAVSSGQFCVHAVETIDDALALLTGLDAGTAIDSDEYPEGSVNHLVRARLKEFARTRRDFSKGKALNDSAD
jgi:lon-related putative ATP-dependent protease